MTLAPESPPILSAGSGVTWRYGERFMLRVAALPYESVEALRLTDSLEWADAVAREEQRLGAAGAVVSELLHPAVSRTDDEPTRRALLSLRREVFKNKLPRDPAAALRLAEGLGGAAGEALAAWVADRAALAELHERGDELVRRETGAARAALRSLADEPAVRLGLVLASPSLDTYVDRYLRGETAPGGKRERRIERSVAEYVYRIACKTSPFSTFTGLALGELDDSGTATVYGGAVGERWRSFPRINVAVLSRLAELIVENPGCRADLPVTLVSGWQRDLDRIRYVRRTVSHGNDTATVGFDTVRDNVFFLHQSAAVNQVVELLGDEPQLVYRDFVTRLAAASDEPVEDCDRFLRLMLDLGLLRVPALAVDIHRPDPLRGFAGQLRTLRCGWAGDVAERLERVAACLDRYADADLPARRTLIGQLRERLTDVQTLLGAVDPTLPQTLVYEDTRAADDIAPCDRRQWTEKVAGPLAALGRMVPAFDMTLAHRLTLKGFFLARFGAGGRCDDVLRLVHDFHEDIYHEYVRMAARRPSIVDGELQPQENLLFQPEITRLDLARGAFVGHMRRAWAGHPGAAEELYLDESAVTGVAAELGPLAEQFRPHGYFLQLARQAEEPLVVVNRAIGGLSFPFSRFTHCFTDVGADGLADELRRSLREVQPPGAVFGEIVGGVASTNLNLHGYLTDYQIVCPGESSLLPPERRIALEDLYVEHDTAGDRVVLRSRRLGCEVIPLYLGYLMPMALPEIPRTLLLFAPLSMAVLDVWGGVPEGAADDGVTSRPRVRYRNVVLARRTWTVPADALPLRTPELTDAEWLLGWRRWRARHGLPERAFATFDSADDDESGGGPAWLGRSKPHYVDFAGPFSLLVLDNLARAGGGKVVFAEMLPAEDELYVRSARGHHVTELAVELTAMGAPPAAGEGRS